LLGFAVPRAVALFAELLPQGLELSQGLAEARFLLLQHMRQAGRFFPLVGQLAAALGQAPSPFFQVVGLQLQLLAQLLDLGKQLLSKLHQSRAFVPELRSRRLSGLKQREMIGGGCGHLA
jgi:hypothetical protein